MKGFVIAYILFLAMAVMGTRTQGQDLSTITDKEMFSLSGNVNIDQMLAPQSGSFAQGGRDPYSYFLTGGLNLSFYGFSMPFNFSYSNQKIGYSHPFTFNQFGAQPSYKWIKAYVGYNTVSFSPYTLGGHQFNGLGFELNPPQWPVSLSMVYGRFLKATEYDSPMSIPAYKRMGLGVKASVNFAKANFSTSTFYAWDQLASIQPIPDSLGILPKENLAFSMEGGLMPIAGLNLTVCVGNSVMTDDKFSAISNERKFWGGLITARNSTSSYMAYKTGLNYSISMGSIGVSHEYIQPGYTTLGAYYFVNDLENLTLNTALRLFDSKLSVGGNFGVQRDNLQAQKVFANVRLVGAGNLTYTPNQKLNINTSYSSFTSYTHLRSVFEHINNPSPYENLDTLNFTQVNNSSMMGATYVFGEDNLKQSSNLSISANQSQNKQQGGQGKDNTVFINGGLTHSVSLSETGWSFSGAVFYSRNNNPFGSNHTFGPFVNASKSFFEGKMRLGLSGAFNKTWLNGLEQSQNVNTRFTGSWSFKDGHNLNLSGAYFKMTSVGFGGSGRSDLVFNLMYSYSFQHSYSPEKKK